MENIIKSKIKEEVIRQMESDIKQSVIDSIVENSSEEIEDLKRELIREVQEEMLGNLSVSNDSHKYHKIYGIEFDTDRMSELVTGMERPDGTEVKPQYSSPVELKEDFDISLENAEKIKTIESRLRQVKDLEEERAEVNKPLVGFQHAFDNTDKVANVISTKNGKNKKFIKAALEAKAKGATMPMAGKMYESIIQPSTMDAVMPPEILKSMLESSKEIKKKSIRVNTNLKKFITDSKIIKILNNNDIVNYGGLKGIEDFTTLKGIGKKGAYKINHDIQAYTKMSTILDSIKPVEIHSI